MIAQEAKYSQAERPKPNNTPNDNRSHDNRKYAAKTNRNRISPNSITNTACSSRWAPATRRLELSPRENAAARAATNTRAAPKLLIEILPSLLTDGYGVRTRENTSAITINFSRLSIRRYAQSTYQKFTGETDGVTSATNTVRSPTELTNAKARNAGICRQVPRFQSNTPRTRRRILGATQR